MSKEWQALKKNECKFLKLKHVNIEVRNTPDS